MSGLLLSALADYPSSRSVHGARRCDSGGRYHNVAAKIWITKGRVRERASAGCESPSGRAIWARSAAQNTRRTCCFRRRARRERSSTPLRSGVAHSSSIIMHTLGLCEPWGADYEPAAMAAARKEPKHSAEYILSTGVVFSQYLTILSHVCRLNTLLCRRIGRGAEGTSCCEVFSLENHPL